MLVTKLKSHYAFSFSFLFFNASYKMLDANDKNLRDASKTLHSKMLAESTNQKLIAKPHN